MASNYEQLVKALLSASTVSTAWEKLMHDAAAAIEDLQAELNSRTIYGYTVEKLIMFAEMCKRNDVQEHDLKQAAWNLELAVRAVMNERQEIIKNAVGEITMRCTPDFEKAFKEMRDKEGCCENGR